MWGFVEVIFKTRDLIPDLAKNIEGVAALVTFQVNEWQWRFWVSRPAAVSEGERKNDNEHLVKFKFVVDMTIS